VRFLGLSGYGGAEIIAMASYFLIHRMTLPYVTPKYDETVLWAAVSALPLLAPYVSWVYLPALWLPLVFVAVRERSRRRFRRYLEEAWARLRRVRPSAPVSGEVGGT
jgi:hypothetical protein